MKTSDVDKGFHHILRRVKLEELRLIPKEVEVGEETSLTR